MMSGFGWAKNPMLNRLHELRTDKHITLLYGSRSWIDKSSWDLVKQARNSSIVNTQVNYRIKDFFFVNFENNGIFKDYPIFQFY